MPPTYSTAKYVFFHIFSCSNCCFLCVAIKRAAFLYLQGGLASWGNQNVLVFTIDDEVSNKNVLILFST